VIPIIFLHGILGSRLRLTKKNMEKLKKKKKTAYDPDDKLDMTTGFGLTGHKERQLMFSPDGCEVNTYEGLTKEQARVYCKNSKVAVSTNSPYLRDDDPGSPKAKTAIEKACERGWGELMFDAYGVILNRMELMMNRMFSAGKLIPDWSHIVGKDPREWGASEALPPLTEADLKKLCEDCWYPVHVTAYNWVRSNRTESTIVAERIKAIMLGYKNQGIRCEKVIVVTHSMGGLVARALCHPEYGNMQDVILGVVHGEQPAIGAAAAYYRMLAGFEIPHWVFNVAKFSDTATSLILGSNGPKVTVILANGGGGLELLPNEAYGNGWLKVSDKGNAPTRDKGHGVLRSLPEKGDPYEEIYKIDGKEIWWGLLREEWINPAGEDEYGLQNTRDLLDKAKEFHQDITSTFHPLTYAHFGCDPERPAFRDIVWEVSISKVNSNLNPKTWEIDRKTIGGDEKNGRPLLKYSRSGSPHSFYHHPVMRPPESPGDQTVPQHSAEHQARVGTLKGIFRQTGFEHQSSYKNENAIASTLYGIVQIAKEMKWNSSLNADVLKAVEKFIPQK